MRMNEEYQQEYEKALSEYTQALKAIHELLNEQSGLDEIKMRVIIDEEAEQYKQLTISRSTWLEARKKYFGFDY
jgi:two-component sensor histidine kinase